MDIQVIIILLIFFLPLIFATISRKKRKDLENELKKSKKEFEVELQASQTDLTTLMTLNTELEEKYSPIINMELHTQQLLDDAHEDVNAMKQESERLIAIAEGELDRLQVNTKDLNSQARQKVQDSKTKATEIEGTARSEAERILEFAKKQAEEIAGDAYEAKQKADSYETAIRAMRNTIEGYKDEYIIPNHSVLDDLADEYTHKEAGATLKATRATVRSMVKEGHAGACDYVENLRKTYAVHFAVDAFNGKVDSALAKVKHDNYGKIEQEIIDAFALVNHNGQPFRNARINQEYLDIRLTELKWAVATFELRKIEKEEQAEIKAQIREEEKVIREIEKARIAAEKEERLIQKALQKVRKELAQASDEQKEQYEAQLAELEGKLQEAEEKGQRALSMAQQTRRGHVYVISNIGSFGEDVFKVGMTRRLEPLDRVKELSDASVPFSFDVHAMIYSDDAPTLEKALHKQFQDVAVNKTNSRKEFFRTSIASIKNTVESQGLNEIHWTMKAEATEYRESLSIEKANEIKIVA
ncbi:DUF4041 domain-containing protein [Psychromonas ossibalaenae]|uniref:DUF4041 domain-containing protein n=1 Tax=Psychromonas ossibalaenae TaxID=444922 RepID=UPI00036F765A|nr:DUF4041 domain-containing protein [Psychromonas ossibalaenae]